MRIANLSGRAVIVTDDGAIDIADASAGEFGTSPTSVFDAWEAFTAWAATATATATATPAPYDPADLRAPSPSPRQSFGIGLNYRRHADESGVPYPEFPPTFTKFASCITGPYATVDLPSENVDWEVELVVVIGRRAERVAAADAWSYVAGLTVGQDLSERVVQTRPPVPQFSLGKSFPGFGPTGPWITTTDEVRDADDLALSCTVNGETVQDSRTGDLIFPVPELIEKLSAILPLLPGDVIFTGTPSGVGMARTPPRFLQPGDVLVSTIEGIGSITTTLR
jgi:2-keto-4-pentenoate hydratase/2-oxohepta-3-ene-1,7-dioic acid hydratase in catechol pathway